ncbi:MAG: thermonuclease family protein [Candidatus Pacearchaeota archaeon]|nr:thermonuclease family protein [Candidatus Pacearchaeota archaeon]
MNSKKRGIGALVVLAIFFLAINYNFLDKQLVNFFNTEEKIHVDRIIDGDTIESNDTSIRLLGINCPEKGEVYYNEAKEFLSSEILNKTVTLKFGKEKEDRYGRTLAYIFLNNENINLKLVEKGLANYYFPSGKDGYYSSFADAWKSCIDKNISLCKASNDKCSRCIELKKLDVKEDSILLYNSCGFSCDLTGWTIKDEGRKKFVFSDFSLNENNEAKIINGSKTNTYSTLYWSGYSYILTSSGDTIFLRDENNGLVLWKSY